MRTAPSKQTLNSIRGTDRHRPNNPMQTKIKQSRFRLTRAVLAQAAADAAAKGDTITAMKFAAYLDQSAGYSAPNQRQRRKLRRQRWAAGDRRAFC
jgi:hypothetical protein